MNQEEEYWENRYNQPRPHINAEKKTRFAKSLKWKWRIIEKYAKNLDSVVDVGCGRLGLWGGKECRQYVGIDISKKVIELNRLSRPDWKFT